MTGPATLCDKIWSAHAIATRAGATLRHVDRHLVHHGSRNAFRQLAQRALGVPLGVRRPDRTFAARITTSRRARGLDAIDGAHRRTMVADLEARAVGITLSSLDNRHIDPFRKDCLLTRVDALGPTLGLGEEVTAFEHAYERRVSWL